MEVNKVILSNLKNPDKLYNLLIKNIDNKDINKSIIYRCIYKLINYNNSKAIVILENLNNYDYTINSLKIKAYTNQKEYLVKAIDLIDNLPSEMHKKRIYMPILNAYLKWIPNKSFNFLVKISNLFKLLYSDILEFIKNPDYYKVNYDILFSIISNNLIILNKNDLNLKLVNPNNLGKIKISNSSRNKLIDNFKNEYIKSNIEREHFDKFKKYKKYNVFLDGNNILFHFKRKITYNSFIRLKNIYLELVEQGYSPLIIIHSRHKKYLKKNFPVNHNEILFILSKLDIYYTPCNMNDDLFFIWAGLNKEDSLIVSNDKFKDHIFKISEELIVSNILSKWIENSVITYKTMEKKNIINIKLHFPKKVTYCAQKVDNKWYIPIGNNKWGLFKIEN